jgi:hypothetical protein
MACRNKSNTKGNGANLVQRRPGVVPGQHATQLCIEYLEAPSELL